ncbi:MAG: cytochrome c nitrite reductase small subunit [Candidatus Latescibacterota bacterium]
MNRNKPPQSIGAGPRSLGIWAIAAAVMVGIFAGVNGFTFLYAEGLSYLGSDPETCANCHIMRSQYDSWQKASHHTVAVCVDCHLPHGLIRKYIAKAENGYHHSKGFTLENFHEPIMIKSKNSRILQQNCVACHEEMVSAMAGSAATGAQNGQCVHCHRGVGHGEPVGLGGPDRGERSERRIP